MERLTVTSFEWDHRIVDTSTMFAARRRLHRLASRPPAEFVAAVQGAAPAVEVETVELGRRLTR